MKNDLSAELKTKITDIIDAMLAPYNIEACRIDVHEDSSGDEAIFIDVAYQLNAKEFDAVVINELQTTVGQMLLENSEERFPTSVIDSRRGRRAKQFELFNLIPSNDQETVARRCLRGGRPAFDFDRLLRYVPSCVSSFQ